ncbi:MAG: BCCT family transporter [Bacillota bacterium]|nr:BCCT family transporter [Bacillota bacterium]
MAEKTRKYDAKIMIFTLIIVGAMALVIALNGEKAPDFIYSMLMAIGHSPVGIFILAFTFFCLIWVFYVAFSKYGKIRLGHGKPEYSNFQYIAMNICAGLGATALIYSFIEWAFYYTTPALGIEAGSAQAMEWSTAYNIFHWGPNMWATNTMAAIPVAYAYYVRRVPSLRLSAVTHAMMGDNKKSRVLSRVVDYLMSVSTCGGICVTLGLGVPLVANGLGKIFHFTPTFGTNVIVCIIVAGLYTLSSWVGLSKGMKVISSANMYLAIGLMVALLVTGPTQFIIKNIVNASGLMLQNFTRMSMWTDPIGGGSFPQDWTIFYWMFGWCFASQVSIFMSQISRGRTLRGMICCLNIGGPAGCLIFFGLNGSFSLNMQMTGELDVAGLVNNEGTAEAVTSILQSAGFGIVGLIIFVVITWLFTATTLDAAAFALSSVSTPHLKEGENTSPPLRLYWCIVLALLPMVMIYIQAPLSSLQTLVVVLTTPMVFIYLLMMLKTMKWMKEDYPRMINGRLPEDMTEEEKAEAAEIIRKELASKEEREASLEALLAGNPDAAVEKKEDAEA